MPKGYSDEELEAKFKWMREHQLTKNNPNVRAVQTIAEQGNATKRTRPSNEEKLGSLLNERRPAKKDKTPKEKASKSLAKALNEASTKPLLMIPNRRKHQTRTRRSVKHGTLRQRDAAHGRVWYCRFRLPPDGGGKVKEVHMTLGRVDEMTEKQATEQMAALVGRVNQETAIARQFGMSSILKDLQIPMTVALDARESIHGVVGHIGALSELIVCTDLLAKGKEVFRAINPHASCDLICLSGGELVRVEVKTVKALPSGEPRPIGLIGKEGKFDILAVVCPDVGTINYMAYSAIPQSGMAYFRTEESETADSSMLAKAQNDD